MPNLAIIISIADYMSSRYTYSRTVHKMHLVLVRWSILETVDCALSHNADEIMTIR